MTNQKIAKRSIGLLIVSHILPVIFIFVALHKQDPWWIGYIAGHFINVVVLLFFGFMSILEWLFE
jgi:hypothetical protein